MLLQEAETDWFASKNIFYNIRTNQISDNINDLLDSGHITFHPEGLRNYLDYGYSVYCQTPVEEIRFLPSNSRIWVNADHLLQIETLSDPFEKFLGNKSTPQDVEEYCHELINQWVDGSEKTVIVPTSGGFDSRFINCMIEKKECIHAYTYGLSMKQDESMEAVYAKKLCEVLKISWKQIELGNFNLLMEDWYKIFGVSTHAHGMYHMEFYDAIRRMEMTSCRVVSGILGDLWSGNHRFSPINHSRELINLALTHNLNADASICKLKERHDLRDSFFENNKEKLKDENWRIVCACRIKIILLSYLLRIPEVYGFETWSPFLDFGCVSRIINLDWKDKERRKWQVEYFRKKNVLMSNFKLECDFSNCLDLSSCLKHPAGPLDVRLLGTILDETYVEEINRNLLHMRQDKLKYYYRYQVLYPLQELLRFKEYGEKFGT